MSSSGCASYEPVYGYAWKTVNGTLGRAVHALNGLLAFGDGGVEPDFEHVAIVVYGYTMEFGSMGVTNKRVQNGLPQSFCNVQSDGRRVYLGQTSKTLEDFFAWYEVSEKKYNKNNYDVVNHNCIHWAQEAADFLGVSHDPAWRNLQSWLNKHQLQARMATSLFDSSSSMSSSSSY